MLFFLTSSSPTLIPSTRSDIIWCQSPHVHLCLSRESLLQWLPDQPSVWSSGSYTLPLNKSHARNIHPSLDKPHACRIHIRLFHAIRIVRSPDAHCLCVYSKTLLPLRFVVFLSRIKHTGPTLSVLSNTRRSPLCATLASINADPQSLAAPSNTALSRNHIIEPLPLPFLSKIQPPQPLQIMPPRSLFMDQP